MRPLNYGVSRHWTTVANILIKAGAIAIGGFVAFAAHSQNSGNAMFKLEGSFESVRQLLEADAKSPMPDDDLDTELWLLLTRQIHAPRDLRRMPESVATYFASRYLQWEVGNGGFAQAAESIPEWFELAETGYIALGKPKSAAIIHRARSLLVAGDEAGLEGLDAEIPTDEWEIDTERVAFVREHRTEFQSIR